MCAYGMGSCRSLELRVCRLAVRFGVKIVPVGSVMCECVAICFSVECGIYRTACDVRVSSCETDLEQVNV